MRKLFNGGLLAILAVAVAMAATPVDAQSGKNPIKIRQAAMKQNSGNLKGVFGFLKGGRRAGNTDTVALRAQALAAIGQQIPGLFPKGTGMDDVGLAVSGAKADIWSKPAEFKAAADNLSALARKLEAAAGTGDKKQIAAAAGALGKQGCGGCHKAFRMKRPKK